MERTLFTFRIADKSGAFIHCCSAVRAKSENLQIISWEVSNRVVSPLKIIDQRYAQIWKIITFWKSYSFHRNDYRCAMTCTSNIFFISLESRDDVASRIYCVIWNDNGLIAKVSRGLLIAS